jgi:hypothetical protein
LKKQFVQNRKNHPRVEKQDYKSRLNGHLARVAARGVIDNDSDADSDDRQASLLRDLDEKKIRLEKSKKGQQDADVGICSL